MTVQELADILNKLIKDGKGNYTVETYDYTVENVVEQDGYIQLKID